MEHRTITSDHCGDYSPRVAGRGRPPNPAGRMVPVSTKVPADVYDALCRLAQRRDLTVAAVLREAILRRALTAR